MSENKRTRIVIGHVGNLPRTTLTASLLHKLQQVVLVDVEGGEVRQINLDSETVTIDSETLNKNVVFKYPYLPNPFKEEKRHAPWGKKAKRQKGYK